MGKITKAREKIPEFSRVVTSRVICGPHVGGVDLGRYLPGKGGRSDELGALEGSCGLRAALARAGARWPITCFQGYALRRPSS